MKIIVANAQNPQCFCFCVFLRGVPAIKYTISYTHHQFDYKLFENSQIDRNSYE